MRMLFIIAVGRRRAGIIFALWAGETLARRTKDIMPINIKDLPKFSIKAALSERSGESRHISSVIDGLTELEPNLAPLREALACGAADDGAAVAPGGRPAVAGASARKAQSVREAARGKASVTRMVSGREWWMLAMASGMQRKLCGPLWFEQEICILFADTNVGKSLLAVQIADMISHGAECDTTLPELRPETMRQPVVYADFELSMAQFARRYSSPGPDGDGDSMATRNYYGFSEMFHRVDLCYGDDADPELFAGKEFADLIISDLERRIEETMAKVLIIDNITFMASGTETAADAMPLMKKLTSLKKRHSLSILLLAHTPKRNLSNPLTRNDLQGSKMLINFADSAFAIGESCQAKGLRYIKQIKQRNCELVYGDSSVIVCSIGRTSPEFVGFTSEYTDREANHLAQPTAGSASRSSDSRRKVRETVTRLHSEGMAVAAIAEKTGLPAPTVYRWIKSI